MITGGSTWKYNYGGKFSAIIREYRKAGLYSPIEQVDGRVKSISSILDKMQRKKINANNIEDKLEDIAGIRLICQFVEDIEKVVEIIEGRTDMEIKSRKDYISQSKDSGYRSYHLIIYYEVNTIYGRKRLQAEIQIRTLAMNFWATVEHSLQYKYKGNIPEHVTDKLLQASDAIVILDQEMSSVRDEIMDAQNSFRKKANMVSDILHTMQNLYKVANKHEVIKIQDEFYKIYETGDMERLEHFNKQLDIIAEGYRAQSIS
nr:GTP pyrophosphokinase family protein [uncultured Anaerostipes sp.]